MKYLKKLKSLPPPPPEEREVLKFDSPFSFSFNDPKEWQEQAFDVEPAVPVAREYDDRQMPLDWDYKTAVTGPNGDVLPDEALGWNYHGQPDFGTGVEAWWKKMTWKLTADHEKIVEGPTVNKILQGVSDTFDYWNTQEQEDKDVPWTKKYGQSLLSLVGGVAQGLGAAWRNKENTDHTEVNALFRLIGAGFDSLGMGFEAADRFVKENITMPLALNAVSAIELNDAAPQETVDKWREWIGPLGLFPLWARGALATITGGKHLDDVTRDRNLLAAQLGYTAWKETATKEEFLRRVRAGEDPRLLAMELQDPVTEMAGEMIFDPLNYLTLAGKTVLNTLGDGKKLTFTFRRAKVGATKIDDAQRALARAAKTQKVEDLTEAIRLAEEAGKTLEEIAPEAKHLLNWAAEQAAEQAAGQQKKLTRISQWRTGKGFFVNHAKALQHKLVENMGDVIHDIYIRTGRSVDDTTRILKAMGVFFDGEADDIARIDSLRHLNMWMKNESLGAGLLFDEDTIKTALAWNELVGKDDAAKFGKKMEEIAKRTDLTEGKKIAVMNEFLHGEMDTIAKKLLPGIDDRIEWHGKWKKAMDAGDTKKADAILETRPWAEAKPDQLHYRLHQIYETVQNKFYKPVGKAQGTIFMGLNPAYRMRNRMGNFAVMFVDQGPGAALMSLTDNRVLPFSKRWARNTLDTWSGGVGIQAQTRGLGTIASAFDVDDWMDGKINYFARHAGTDEATAGVHIMARAMRRVVKRVLTPKKALSDIYEVVDPEDAKVIRRLSHKLGGDVKEATRMWAAGEGIDDVSTLLFLDDMSWGMLEDMGLDDTFLKAVGSEYDDVQKVENIQEIKDAHRLHGDQASGENIARVADDFTADLDDDMIVGIDGLTETKGAKYGERQSMLFNRQVEAQRLVVDTAIESENDLFSMTSKMIQDQKGQEAINSGQTWNAGRDAAMAEIDTLKKATHQTIADRLGVARKELDEFREWTVETKKLARERPREYVLEMWKDRAEKGLMKAVPDGDDWKVDDFISAMWDGYFPHMKGKWRTYFLTEAEERMKMIEVLIDMIDPDEAGDLRKMFKTRMDQVRRKQGIADAYHRGIIDEDGFVYMRLDANETEDFFLNEWDKLNKTRAEEVEGLSGTAFALKRTINDLRNRVANGELDLDTVTLKSLERDDTFNSAIVAAAGSQAKADDFLRTMLSREPDNVLLLEKRIAEREFFLARSATQEEALVALKEIDAEIEKIGNPTVAALTPEGKWAIDTGDEVRAVIGGLEQDVEVVRVNKKSVRVKFGPADSPEEATVSADKIFPRNSELRKQERLEDLRRQREQFDEISRMGPEELSENTLKRRQDFENEIRRLEEEVLDPDQTKLKSIIDDKFEEVDNLEELAETDKYAKLVDPKEGPVYRVKLREDGVYGYVQIKFGAEGGKRWAVPRLWIPKQFQKQDLFPVLMDQLKEVADEGRISFHLTDIPLDPKMTPAKLRQKYLEAGMTVEEIPSLLGERLYYKPKPYRPSAKGGKPFTKPIITPQIDGTPTPAAVSHRLSPVVNQIADKIIDHIKNNPSGTGKHVGKYSPEQMVDLRKAATRSQAKVNDARMVGRKIAVAERDFGLHNYGDRLGLDLVAGLIFPYQFWYSRSYAKWMKRLAQHPGVMSAYMRYRRTLEHLHAGMPEWWKYQLNVGEMLGMDEKNPLYFNLEAMINPLHGLTGTDFTDPQRRKDWWGAAMEDVQKMGPSVWTPFTFALAAKYSYEGEKEAAARWAGRLLPQSKMIRDVTALFDPKGLGTEIDPYVLTFGGGVEAYERGRVGRQLGMMMHEGKWTPEDIIDAAYTQSGEIWDIARARAINDRGGNLARISGQFLFGVGLKPRPALDMQIDNMYREMHTLLAGRTDIPEDEYRQQWNVLREAYPFMDTVLLSKKHGLSRDEALAWNVLNRIPPGMSHDFAEKVNMDYDVLTQFRESKGDLTQMNEAERFNFMSGILQMSAMLAIPEPMTTKEWTEAKRTYGEMLTAGRQTYGDDIWLKVDLYYGQYDEDNPDAMRNFLKANPIVEEALDFKQMVINDNPLLLSYYGGVEQLEKFYKGQFYQTAEQTLGKDIWDKWTVYHALRDAGEYKAAQQYYKDNPELKGYTALREDVMPIIEAKIDELGKQIQSPKGPFYRKENTMPDPAVGVQSFNVDAQQQWIDDQIMAYSQGQKDADTKKYTDVVDIIRNQADAVWPNTVQSAKTYYATVDKNPSQAAGMLQENPELEARIKWEFENIMRVALARDGELEASAARFQQELTEMGATEPTPTAFEQLAPGPLQRLLNDPEGLPPHLWELLTRQ